MHICWLAVRADRGQVPLALRPLTQLQAWRPRPQAGGPFTYAVWCPLCGGGRKLPARGPKAPDLLLTTRKLNQIQGQENRSANREDAQTVMRRTTLTAGVRWTSECSKINLFSPSNAPQVGRYYQTLREIPSAKLFKLLH